MSRFAGNDDARLSSGAAIDPAFSRGSRVGVIAGDALLQPVIPGDGEARALAPVSPTPFAAPTLTGLESSLTVVENAPPQLIDADVVLSDVDGDLANGRVTVSGLLAEDRVAIRNEGTAAGQIGVSGTNVTYGGVTIGTLSGGTGATFVVALNGAATGAAVDALIQNLTYANASDAPIATRTLRINVIDSTGAGIGNPATFTPLTGASNPFGAFDVGLLSKPTFLDFDNDGDLDLVSGEEFGTLFAYRNNGNGTFTQLTGTANPFNGIDVGIDSTPAAADLDGDGDLDLLIGENDGFFNAYRNNGNGTFAGPISLAGLTGIDYGTDTAPAFVDFDGDGDLDVVSGETNGTLFAFRNNGSGSYTMLGGGTNPFAGIDVGTISAPSFLDFDADGDFDALIGEVNGTALAYRNNGNGTFTNVTGAANPFNGLNAGFDAALAFVDLDGDGDLDAVSGTRNGTFLTFRNDATNGVPITVNVTAQNDAPATANLQGDVVAYTEQVAQRLLDLGSNATIADPDSGNFNGGSLRVQITAGLQAGVDFIFFVGNGRVSLSGQSAGATVFVQLAGDASPVAIGTLANDNLFQNNTVINFNSDNATPARVQELLRSITYNGNSDNLTSGQRTITYTLNDGDGGSSTTTSFVDVTAVNDVPVVNAGAGQASFSEGVNVTSTPVAVASGLTVSDPDNATFASATVTISANREASDVLAFTNTNSIFGNIAASYDAATGVLTLTSAGATATRTQFQAALRAVTFTSTSEEPSTTTRTISFVVNDGAANSVTSTRQILVQANNDAPSGTSQTLVINEDQVRTLSESDFGFSDIDGDAFAGVRFGTAPTGGTLYYDADGPGVGNAPVAITTFPTTTYTAADLAAGRITFVPTANLNGSAAAAITFSVVDDGGTVGAGQNADLSPNTLTFTIDAINDPIATNAPAALSVGEDTTTAIPGLSISDVDAALAPAGVYEVTLSATQGNLTLATLAGLTFTTGDGGDDTVMTFHGTIADINAALATATFSPTPGYSGSAQIDIQATDSFGGVVATGAGSATTDSDTIAVTVVANNPAPVLDLNGADAGTGIDYVFDEQGGSIVAPDAIVSDLTSANFDGGTLTVSYGAAMHPTDAFGVSDEGGFFATGGRIGVNNDNIYYDRVLIGTLSSFGLGQPLVITLNSAATPEAVQRLVQRVSIFNASDTPPVGTRALVFSLDDGDGNVGSATANVTITAVNDAPVIANLDGDTATLTEADSAASQIAYLDAAANAVVTDADSVNFNGGTLDIRITSGFVANQDQLGIAGTARVSIAGNFVLVDGTAVGTFTGGGPGQNFITLTLDDANPDRVQEVLRAVFQYNSAGEPTPGIRGITITLSDGDGGSTTANVSVDVVAVNDAPVLTSLIPSATVSEATASTPIIIDSSVTFFDPEGNLANGNLTVSGLLAEDRIAIRNQGTGALQIGVNGANVTFQGVVIGTFTGGVGNSFTVTFNSSATNSGVDALIQNLTYQNVSDTPTGNRTLSFVVTDGAGAASTPATILLNVTPTNDAPVVAANAGTVDEGGDLVLSAATLDYNDPEQGDASIEYLIDALPTRGTLLLNGVALAVNGTFTQADINAGRVTYRHDGSETIADSFQFTVSDNAGANVTGQTFNLTVTPVNDAPSSTGFDNITYTEGDGVRNLDVGFNQVLTDIDSANFDGGTLTVSITGNKVATEDQLTFTTGGTSFLSASGGVLSYHGVVIATYTAGGVGLDRVFTFNANATLEAVQTVMRNIAYINTNQGNPDTAQRTVSYTLTDGDGGTLNLTSTINVVRVNDAPTFTAPTNANIGFTEGGAPTALMQGVVLSDADTPGSYVGGSISLVIGGTGGGINLRPGSSFSIASNGDGTFSLNLDVGGTSIGIGTISGFGTTNVQITGLTAEATLARVNDLIDDFIYINLSDNPDTSARTVTLTVDDGTGGAGAVGSVTQTLTVTATDDPPTSTIPVGTQNGDEDSDLVFSTAEGNAISVNDPDGGVVTVTLSVQNGTLTLANVNGLSFAPGGGDGTGDRTMTFTGTAAAINAALNGLTYRGDLNYSGSDTLAVNVDDGVSSVFKTISITLAADNVINDDSGDNNLDGTPQSDFFDLSQGGDENLRGYEGDDGFWFGGAYTVDDVIDGGAGNRDTVGLQGDYSGGVTLGSLTGVEIVAVMPGNDNRFGGGTGASFNYNITADANTVVSNNKLTIQGNTLRATENLTFDGSASGIDFFIYGGLGVDVLTGGSGSDAFFFGQARFGQDDVVDGGVGTMDQLGLQGDYTGVNAVVFGEDQLVNLEYLVLVSASDNRFGSLGNSVDYDVTMHDGNVADGGAMVISANTLRAGETVRFDGSAELDGAFRIYSGAGDDVLLGSQTADIIFAGGGNDVIAGNGGADQLTGGAGNDRFVYAQLSDSTDAARDRIFDFGLGDQIDLRELASTLGVAGFQYIGSATPTGPGQLQVTQTGNQATIRLFADGDTDADLVISVTTSGGHQMAANDFLGLTSGPVPVLGVTTLWSGGATLFGGEADGGFDFTGISSHGGPSGGPAIISANVLTAPVGGDGSTDFVATGTAFMAPDDVVGSDFVWPGDFRPTPEPYGGSQPDDLLTGLIGIGPSNDLIY